MTPNNWNEEQVRISNKNRDKLRKKLGLKGYDYVLHHKDVNMRYEDIERYIQWNEEDIVVLTRSEHSKLHGDILSKDSEWCFKCTNKVLVRAPLSEETKKKISEGLKESYKSGKWKPKGPKGKHWNFTESQKENLSNSVKETYKNGRVPSSLGKHWYHNENSETYSNECPEGYIKGRLPKKHNR